MAVQAHVRHLAHELGRVNDPKPGMPPAEHRLHPTRSPRREVNLGLEQEEELVALDGITKLVCRERGHPAGRVIRVCSSPGATSGP